METKLKELIKDTRNFRELEEKLRWVEPKYKRGKLFEEFCEALILCDSSYGIKEVWEEVGDIGTDRYGLTHDNKLVKFQMKFRRDRSNYPGYATLSTFITDSEDADGRLIMTNADGVNEIILSKKNMIPPTLGFHLDSMDGVYDKVKTHILDQSFIPAQKFSPREDQEAAIVAGIKHYEKNDRGQLILPCGVGKTITSLWLIECLNVKTILIFEPSLSLIKQTLDVWYEQSGLDFTYFALCSDATVDQINDSGIKRASTNPEDIERFLAEDKEYKILFSTYQSGKVLSEVVNKVGIKFDFAVFDEAHRTAGSEAGLYNIGLEDKNVPIKKRLFMTATPRIYHRNVKSRFDKTDIILYDMDNEDQYGKIFYEMTFGDAIERGLISDYKVVIAFADDEIQEMVERRKYLLVEENGEEWAADALAKRLIALKVMKQYGRNKTISFHNRVDGAKQFSLGELSVPSLAHNFDMKVDGFHVNGHMRAKGRAKQFRKFEESECSLISAARCLNEGVDIPVVDCAIFCDPKKSSIDIVQATGRILRKSKTKEFSLIVVPVVLSEDGDIDENIRQTKFDHAWDVLQAIQDRDERIRVIVSKLKTMLGKETKSKEWNAAMKEFSDKVEIVNLPSRINITNFTERLHVNIIERTCEYFDFWKNLIKEMVDKGIDPNVSKKYEYNGYKVGEFVSRVRHNYKMNKLNLRQEIELRNLGIKMDIVAETFFEIYTRIIDFRNKYNHFRISVNYVNDDGYPLGKKVDMVKSVRGCYLEYQYLLDRIGFPRSFIDDKFMEDVNSIKDDLVPSQRQFGREPHMVLPDGHPKQIFLSSKISQYKKGKLPHERADILMNLNIRFNPHEESFFENFEHLVKWYRKHGHTKTWRRSEFFDKRLKSFVDTNRRRCKDPVLRKLFEDTFHDWEWYKNNQG